MIIETSWEVCNKVGGIYTVLTSKAPYMPASYLAIGPLVHYEEFKEKPLPKKFAIVKTLEQEGIRVKFGSWKTEGKPDVMLVDVSGYWHMLNAIKTELWETYKISSIRAGHDYDEPLLWSYAVGKVIACFAKKQDTIQCHEWLSGGTILYLAKHTTLKTIFTTHATILGRTLTAHNRKLYLKLSTIKPDKEAYNANIEAKHGVEKATAKAATVFTTVSAITGKEAGFILGKKPHIILPNGIDNKDIIGGKLCREKLESFVKKWFPKSFDVKKALFFSIAGRYEYRAKGVDLFIKALGKLNNQLKDKTVVAFFWIPAAVFGEQLPGKKPPLSTYFMAPEDPMTNALENASLTNLQEERVKVLIHPQYITKKSFGMRFYDVLRGSDLGVFPSYYEPWGYTPLETAAVGVPAITTDLAGFGRWVQQHKGKGVTVLKREKKEDEEVVDALAKEMLRFTKLTAKQRKELGRQANKLAQQVDWKKLIQHYKEAWRIAHA